MSEANGISYTVPLREHRISCVTCVHPSLAPKNRCRRFTFFGVVILSRYVTVLFSSEIMVRIVSVVVVAMCVVGLLAAPAPQQQPEIELVRYVNENNGIDPYHYT